jgi:outer membrane immunogenic protein
MVTTSLFKCGLTDPIADATLWRREALQRRSLRRSAMNKFQFAVVALAALGASAPALAADLGARPYSKAPVYAAPLYNWTGFYVGGHLGGAFSGSNHFNGLALGSYSAQFLGGVQAGADYQFSSNWVAGVEGQYSWLGRNNVTALFPAGFGYSNDTRGLGSLTGRIGYSFGPALLYAKGGYAYADYREALLLNGAPVAFTLNGGHHNGYTVGGGLEYMLTLNWSTKAEYQYYDFGSRRFVAPQILAPFGSFRADEHTVKAGVNYRFNWGGAVAARY